MSKLTEKTKNFKNRSKKIIAFKDLTKLAQVFKDANQKVVFTTGSFDLLNPGHCRYLAEAKTKGDILVVGVSTNFSDAKIKAVTLLYNKLGVKQICEDKMQFFYTKAVANLKKVNILDNNKQELANLADNLMFRKD